MLSLWLSEAKAVMIDHVTEDTESPLDQFSRLTALRETDKYDALFQVPTQQQPAWILFA